MYISSTVCACTVLVCMQEEGDCPKAEGSNAREKVAQAFFVGVGGVISSVVPFDEDDENSSGGGFDDEEFVEGGE